MNDEMTILTKNCLDCYSAFVLSPSECDFFHMRGLQLPKRCKDCRRAIREARAQQTQSPDAA